VRSSKRGRAASPESDAPTGERGASAGGELGRTPNGVRRRRRTF
jgi:hypothetical protein